jgi:hypothetical protein
MVAASDAEREVAKVVGSGVELEVAPASAPDAEWDLVRVFGQGAGLAVDRAFARAFVQAS